MHFRTAHVCEGSNCCQRASVYLDCSAEPPLETYFEYTCPRCRRLNVFALVALIVVREIPRNALMARMASPPIETLEDTLTPSAS
jgi:hypothetical protein